MNLVGKSLKVLKSLQLKNGAILATFKNDAYPYVYPRDGVFITKALNLHGLHKRSEKFYYFLRSLNHDMEQRFHGFGSGTGLPYVTQRGETDIIGIVLQGINNTFNSSLNRDFLKDMWPLVEHSIKHIGAVTRNGLVLSRRSVHEFFEAESGHEIWANSACCRGLYDAAEISKHLGKSKQARKFEIMANNLKKNILRKLFDGKRKVFVKLRKTSGAKLISPDISIYSPFYFDIIKPNHVLKKTMQLLRNTIWHKKLGGFLRWRPFETCKNWHWYTGGDGPFVMFTIIATGMFKKLKDEKHFEEGLEWIKGVATKEGFFPERFSLKKDYEQWKANEHEFSDRILNGIARAEKIRPPIKGTVYWATPLGWSNAEYVMLDNYLRSL